MDFSSRYILLVGKAAEVQKTWKLKLGDWVAIESTVDIFKTSNIVLCTKNQIRIKKGQKAIFVPRQDQLQDLVLKNWIMSQKLKAFVDFMENKDVYKTAYQTFQTLEQAWLGFVMFTGCQKVWDRSLGVWRSLKEGEDPLP